MKHLFLLSSIIFSASCFSQGLDTLLFQTWYLKSVYTNDSSYVVRLINPPITPTISISTSPATPVFAGTGACNTFNGRSIVSSQGQFETIEFTPTTLSCGPEIHNSFEASYFSVLQSATQYQIYWLNTGGIFLTIFNPTFGAAEFQDFPLSTTEFDTDKIAICPNPAKSVISLNSKQAAILKIDVINLYGQIVKTINDAFETINISDLSSGIYMLKINTELGTTNKKIIKE